MAASKVDLNRNITRLETSTRGFQVRLCRRGKYFSKLFSDAVFGGKRKALQAAREYRDSMIEELAPRELSRKQLARRKNVRNTSGVTGVRFVQEEDPRAAKGVVYEYWEAQWSPEPGIRSKKRFSVRKFGYEKALKLAKSARAKGVREMVE